MRILEDMTREEILEDYKLSTEKYKMLRSQYDKLVIEMASYKTRVTEAEMREQRAQRIVELLAQALANRSD